ncbi:MAG TPA: FecR domain-containing protein [Steroidobacter sp.]|uniref:FecR domain-containing protein n=1 Tax=Steroidobacter sp. TaxID=1978227 RepID=UPI002EDAA5E3
MTDANPDAAVLPSQVIDAAIDWCVRLDYSDATPDVRLAFESWLAADALHALAWQRVRSLNHPFKKVSPRLVRATLDSAAAERTKHRRNALKLLATGGFLLVGSSYLLREVTPWERLLADASTRVGERRTVRLADETLLELNTDSAVTTDLTGARRLVHLRRGEMLIQTGADSLAGHRPFWVRTPFGTMQALGTRFNVRLEEQSARISVQEGAVELHPAGSTASTIVRGGESYQLHRDAALRAESTGIRADAWVDGVIVAKDARLADVLAELARYRVGAITCDPQVADLRLSGIFQVRDTDKTLQFLVETHSLRISYRSRFWVRVAAAGR